MLLGRKKAATHKVPPNLAVRVRRFVKPDATAPRDSYVEDLSSLGGNRHSELTPLRFRRIWERLRSAGSLGDVALVFTAIQAGPGREESFSQTKKGSTWKPCIKGAALLEPYALRWGGSPQRYVDYPSNLRWPRLRWRSHFARPKVITNSSRAPASPWRLYAAADGRGCFPVGDLHCVAPRRDDDGSTELALLTAVLNSPVANAWVDETSRTRYIRLPCLRELPYPAFHGQQRRSIHRLVRKIEAEKTSVGRKSAPAVAARIRELIRQVDAAVMDAYGLTSSEQRALTALFVGSPRPGMEWHGYPTDDAASAPQEVGRRSWRVVGTVTEVDAARQRVRVWIRGLTEDEQSVWVAAWPAMPGWALRPGTWFQADVPWAQRYQSDVSKLALSNFRSLLFSHLSDDELAHHVEQMMKGKKLGATRPM